MEVLTLLGLMENSFFKYLRYCIYNMYTSKPKLKASFSVFLAFKSFDFVVHKTKY